MTKKESAPSIKEKHILDAAIRLLGQHGVGIATAKIAQLAGISNGTLFNYYPTKQNLLDKVYLSIKEEVARQFTDGTREKTHDSKTLFAYFWRRYIAWALANPLKQSVASLLKSSTVISDEANNAVDDTFRFIRAHLESAQHNQEIKTIPTELLCEIAIAQMLATIQHAHQHDVDELQLNRLIQQSFDIYWDGIKLK